MVMSVEKHLKRHLFIFSLLSVHLFIITPIAFISRFLAVAVCIGVLLFIRSIKFEFKRWYDIVVYIVINAYLTFAIFGYDLFLDNVSNTGFLLNLTYLDLSNPKIKAATEAGGVYINLIYYGLGFVWTSYVLQSFYGVINSLCRIKEQFCSPSNENYWKKWLILFSIIFVMFMIWQRTYNPVVMSNDSWDYIDGWRNGNYSTFRSPIYAFLIYIICSIAPTRPEVEWIAIVQILAFSSLLATILMYFHKKWIRYKYIILSAVILPMIPSFGLLAIVIWPDLACGMSMLWLTYILVRIFDEQIIHQAASKKQCISFYIQLCMSLVLVYFIRSNSFLVYLVMAPVLALTFSIWKQWKLFASVVLSVMIVLVIQFPGYKALKVQRHEVHNQVRYYAAIHDIQATYYEGGKLSEQTLAAVRRYLPRLDDPEIKAAFIPDEGFAIFEFDEYFEGLSLSEFLSIYIDSFVNNPFKMLKSMLYRVRAYWVIDSKGHITCVGYSSIYVRSTDTWTTQAPEIGVSRKHYFMTNLMDKYILASALPVLSIFIWRFGIWTALIIISIMMLILQKRHIFLLAYLPVFVYIVTLFLTSAWLDYRYGLPVFFIGLFLPLTIIMLQPANKDKESV